MNILSQLKVLIGADSSELNAKLAESQEKISQWTEKVGGVLEGVTFAGLGIGAVAASEKFEEASARIQRSTGATGEKLEELEKSFADVYKQTGASADAVAQVLSLLSTRSNATGEDLDNLALKTLRLAKTQKEDVTAIVPSLTGMFGAWHIATTQQASAMDYLRVVSQQTGTPILTLTEELKSQAPILQALGFNWQQSATLIGNFEKAGVNVGGVMAGLKSVLKNFAKEGVADTAAEWKKLVEGVKNGSVTFDQFIKIAGARGGTYLFQAIRDGVTDVGELSKRYQELAEQGGANVETLHEKVTKLTHSIEELVARHKDLILSINLAIPAVAGLAGVFVKMSGTVLPIIANIANAIRFNMLGALTSVEALIASGGLIGLVGVAGYLLAQAAHDHTPPPPDRGYTASGRKLPNLKSAPEATTPPPATPPPGFGGGDAAENWKKDFAALGITDVQDKLDAAVKAFNELTAAGKLNAGQMKEAKDKIADLRGELATLASGMTPAEAKLSVLGQKFGPDTPLFSFIDKEKGKEAEEAFQKVLKVLVDVANASEDWGKKLATIHADLSSSDWDQWMGKLANLPTIYQDAGAALSDLQAEQDRLLRDVQITTDAFHSFGLKTRQELENTAEDAEADFDILATSGEATSREIEGAWLASAEKRAAADLASGLISQKAYDETVERIKASLDKLNGYSQETTLGKELGRSARGTFTSIENELAKDIVQWKGWQKSVTQIAESLAEDFLKIMLRGLLKPLEDGFANLAQNLGTKLGGIFGGSHSGVGGFGNVDMDTVLATAVHANTTAVLANTAATTGNTAGEAANTGSTLANTAATAADAAATATSAGAQIAALVANTTTEAVTSSVSFASETANTAALMANTAALATDSAGSALGGLSGLLSIFGFAGGGDVQKDGLVKVHEKEMVLPPNVAQGFRSLFSSSSSFRANQVQIPAGSNSAAGDAYTFSGCTFGQGLTKDMVSQIFQSGIRQAKLAGAFRST